jgi:hypothetical protein
VPVSDRSPSAFLARFSKLRQKNVRLIGDPAGGLGDVVTGLWGRFIFRHSRQFAWSVFPSWRRTTVLALPFLRRGLQVGLDLAHDGDSLGPSEVLAVRLDLRPTSKRGGFNSDRCAPTSPLWDPRACPSSNVCISRRCFVCVLRLSGY